MRASAGSIRPSDVVKVTSVPLCTGVPADGVVVAPVPVPELVVPLSMSTAMRSVLPLTGSTLVEATSVITVPAGAVNGTLSHAAAPSATTAASAMLLPKLPAQELRLEGSGEGVCSNMRVAKDFTFMDLVGQGCSDANRLRRSASGLDARGFTMVVLLVVMAVMAIGTAALLPTWRQQAIREQEEELIFRGNQYARALVLYSRKNSNLLPANIDVLYTGKYLRKKYKDPITGDEFGLLPAGQPPGAAGRGSLGGAPPSQSGGRSGGVGATPQGGRGAPSGTQIVGSIQGVYSKSTNTSIRVYQNQQRYIDWPFTVQTAQLMMGLARGIGAGGQPGRAGGDGGRGGPGGARGVGPGTGGARGVGSPGRGVQPGPAGRGGAAPPTPVGGRGRGGL